MNLRADKHIECLARKRCERGGGRGKRERERRENKMRRFALPTFLARIIASSRSSPQSRNASETILLIPTTDRRQFSSLLRSLLSAGHRAHRSQVRWSPGLSSSGCGEENGGLRQRSFIWIRRVSNLELHTHACMHAAHTGSLARADSCVLMREETRREAARRRFASRRVASRRIRSVRLT